jgi:hypothetical protein
VKFEKGHRKIGGRKDGSKNRTTKEAKEILNIILFAELDNIQDALNDIRNKSSMGYLETLSKLLAFSLPKKTDITSDDAPLKQTLNIMIDKSETAETLKQLRDGCKTE